MTTTSDNTKQPTQIVSTKATRASEWPLPKGCVVMDGKPESHIFVGGVNHALSRLIQNNFDGTVSSRTWTST